MKLIKRVFQYLIIGSCAVLSVVLINSIFIEMNKPPVEKRISGVIVKTVLKSGFRISQATIWIGEYNNKKYGITAGHFCSSIQTASSIKLQGGATLDVIVNDLKNDVCVLRLLNGDYLNAFPIIDVADDLKQDDIVEYMGYPNGEQVMARGRYYGVETRPVNFGPIIFNLDCELVGFSRIGNLCFGNRELFVTNLLADKGASGSPVISNNRVVGVLTELEQTFGKYGLYVSINKVILNLKRVSNGN